ncbi:hypothetical protein [Sphaerisporangium album]|nr:hypothetical protein [Sphaerisporangium album]
MATFIAVAVTGCGSSDFMASQLTNKEIIDPERPFANSPSEHFGDGPKGIVIPAAQAVKGYSKKDVETAYKTSKELLVAAYLDPKVLVDGRTDGFADMLDPEQRKHFLKDLDNKDPSKNTRGWVTSFAPGFVDLVGDVIKVKGTISAISAVEDGDRQINVLWDYRIVYAVRPKGKSTPVDRTMQHVKGAFQFWRDEPKGKLRHWIGDTSYETFNSLCEPDDDFLRPDFYSNGGGTGPEDDPYDEASPKLPDGECGVSGDV